MNKYRITSAALTLPLLLFIAGCGAGAGAASVSGEVKHKGQPLAGAVINFYDASNKVNSDTVAADGKYEVTNLAVGVAKIEIITPIAISFDGGLPGGKTAAGSEPKKYLPTLPAKYGDREQSGLTLTVKSGSQVHNIALD